MKHVGFWTDSKIQAGDRNFFALVSDNISSVTKNRRDDCGLDGRSHSWRASHHVLRFRKQKSLPASAAGRHSLFVY